MAKRNVKIYYTPPSFYSQKVLIAAQEKELKYEPVFVDIHSFDGGEQTKAAYMRMSHNKGVVPVLQDGEKTVVESEDIVEYIDREFPTDLKLVPDQSTGIGKEVAKWRKDLNDVPIDQVTFGIMVHPDISVTGIDIPSAFKKKLGHGILANLQIQAAKLEQLADEHPDLREAYMAKVAAMQKRRSAIADKEKVEKILNDLEPLLDRLEEQLKKMESDPSKEIWLCGQQFTAADINLCIMLGRLDMMGVGARFYTAEKRPLLFAYWQAAKKRPSINKVTVNARRNLMKLKAKQVLLKALPIVGGVVTVGLAAGLAVAFAVKKS